ncbi:hypothetical protein N331_10124, partial [Merops nubicus]
VRPLIKTEYTYLNGEDSDPQITTKETPYTAAELAKLKREYRCPPKESETEDVWHVVLTGGDPVQLSEQEPSAHWGHGVSLTTRDKCAPWPLAQRAASWAGDLNPLDRGDPPATTGTADQLLESAHRAACLQKIHERKLIPRCESQMMLPVNPEIVTPLIKGLPESFKSTGIDLQGSIVSKGPAERLKDFMKSQGNEDKVSPNSTFNHRLTPSQPGDKRVWTCREVAQELIN